MKKRNKILNIQTSALLLHKKFISLKVSVLSNSMKTVNLTVKFTVFIEKKSNTYNN